MEVSILHRVQLIRNKEVESFAVLDHQIICTHIAIYSQIATFERIVFMVRCMHLNGYEDTELRLTPFT